ncbi:hypothetical protein KSS87_000480 [Heliosperma pusillum]|nr:hypothetical protein KSS87_000480 [Heliosperma pusillum]
MVSLHPIVESISSYEMALVRELFVVASFSLCFCSLIFLAHEVLARRERVSRCSRFLFIGGRPSETAIPSFISMCTLLILGTMKTHWFLETVRHVEEREDEASVQHSIPLNSKALVVHDIEALNHVDPNSPHMNSPRMNSGNGVPNGAPFANNLMTGTKKLQDELEKTGTKMRQHEDNLKFLKSQKNQLDDAILDLQVSLGKSLSSGAPNTEDGDSSLGRSEEETVEQISKHENSAANIFCQLKSRHGIQPSNPILSQELLGVVATLGKVEDDNLSRLFSEYLGLPKMLSVVCKTYDGIKSLETYDLDGAVNKFTGIYALGSSVGHSLEGRPYAGEIIADDPQRRLDILHPRLPNGEIPAGFLGFAVNMVHIDRSHLYCLTSSGCGLRETLFYNLFSRLQVYRTRAEMLLALPFITDGAVSLDGGMISATGVFALGSRACTFYASMPFFSCCELQYLANYHCSQLFLHPSLEREDVGVRFPRCSGKDRLPVKYYELENQLKQKKWEKERLQEDIRREQALLDQQKYNYQLQKQEFLRFLADSSSFLTQHQLQTAVRDRQTPRCVEILGAWRVEASGISARRHGKLQKEVLAAGQAWTYDPERKKMQTKRKGHKCDRISAVKRTHTVELMKKTPQILFD